jgi:hypothetical protein
MTNKTMKDAVALPLRERRKLKGGVRRYCNTPWFNISWTIVDKSPAAIPMNAQSVLAGMIAGALSEMYNIGKEGGVPEQHPLFQA